MSMEKKNYSKQEKLKILKEASERGVKPTLDKYNVYPTTFYYWRNKYESLGDGGLNHGNIKADASRLKELEKELRIYKELVAEKDLLLRLKDELLKKKYPQTKK